MVKAFPAGLKPNLYELTDALHGDGVVISYITAGLDGKQQFLYRDVFISRSVAGDDIRMNETEIGTLVTIQNKFKYPSTQVLGEPRGQADMYNTVNLTGSAMFFQA